MEAGKRLVRDDTMQPLVLLLLSVQKAAVVVVNASTSLLGRGTNKFVADSKGMPGNILIYNCELSSGYCTLSVLSRCVVEELLPTTLGIIWSSVTVPSSRRFCPVLPSAQLVT